MHIENGTWVKLSVITIKCTLKSHLKKKKKKKCTLKSYGKHGVVSSTL